MRLDQLTDGLNSTEPSVVCTTLRHFRQEIYLAYAEGTGGKQEHGVDQGADEASYSRLLMFRAGLLSPTSLLLEFCDASPEMVELFTIWNLGTESVCVEVIETFALVLLVGRHPAITQATKRIVREKIDDGVANVINKTASVQAIPYLKLFAGITRQGMMSASALLSKLKVSFKAVLRVVHRSDANNDEQESTKTGTQPRKRKYRARDNTPKALKLRFFGARFLLGLLQCGAPDIQQEMLEHKGFVQTLITGLPEDHIIVVEETLATLEKNILNSSRLPRLLKKRVFGAMMLRNIVKLITKNYCSDSFDGYGNSQKKSKHQYIAGIVEGDAKVITNDQTSADKSNHSKTRKKASLLGIDFLRNLLCGESGKIFFSNTDYEKNRKNNNILKCSPLIFEVLQQLSPVRFDNHRNLVFDVLEKHPMVIEKYVAQLPYNIEPSSTPKWFAIIVLLKQIFEIETFQQFVKNVNFESSHMQLQNALKMLLPISNVKHIINRGLLHKDNAVCFATLKLLESILERLHRCRFVFDKGTDSKRKELKTKIRAHMPSFGILQSNLAKVTKSCVEQKIMDVNDGNKTVSKHRTTESLPTNGKTFSTVKCLLECMMYYIKIFPEAASDAQFDASRFMDVVDSGEIWDNLMLTILNVVQESAKKGLFHWNRFLKSNNQISPLRKILMIYVPKDDSYTQTKFEERNMAKSVTYHSILSIGLFSRQKTNQNKVQDKYVQHLKRRELRVWLGNITSEMHVQIFDKAICQIVQKPLNFLPTALSTLRIQNAFSSFTIAMQMLLLHCVTEKKLPKHYVGKESSVVRFIVDGFKSLARAWPTPFDIFELISPILEEETVRTYMKQPSKSSNDTISILVHFAADLVKYSGIEDALRSREGSNHKWVLERTKIAARESTASVAEGSQFSHFINAIGSSEKRCSNKDFKMFFHLLDNSARQNLFDLRSVISVFEGQNSKTYDTNSNLIKFLSQFPADVLLAELMASTDQTVASMDSQAHNTFIEDVHRKEEQANFDEMDLKHINEMWNDYNYGSTKCNILNLLFGAFDDGMYNCLNFLWKLVNIEPFLRNCNNQLFMFEILGHFLLCLNKSNVIRKIVSNNFFHVEAAAAEFVISICRFLSSSRKQIDLLGIDGFASIEKVIYECLGVFIDSNISSRGSSEINTRGLEVLSSLCELLDSENKLNLAMRLVKKLEQLQSRHEQLTQCHQSLLSYLITGASANLSRSEEIEKTLLLLRLCVSIISQINDRKEINVSNYYDAGILDKSCLLLLKCLAHVERKRVIEHIEINFVKYIWQNCTNVARGDMLSILVLLTNNFANEALMCLKQDLSRDDISEKNYFLWIYRLPCILTLICNTNYDEEHDTHLRSILKQGSLNEILIMLISENKLVLKENLDLGVIRTACCILQGIWFYCRKHEISIEKHSVNTLLSAWSSRIQGLSEKKNICGKRMSTAYASAFIHFANCAASHMCSVKPVTIVLNAMLTCMGQLVVLRSKIEKTCLEKRMWTTCMKECITTFYFVSQHIEGDECDEWYTLNQNLCKKISLLFPSFVKASLKYGYFDETIIGILNESIIIFSDMNIISKTSASFSASNTFDMIIGHSRFREIVALKSQTWMFNLMHTLAKIDANECFKDQRAKFVLPILLAAYEGSLCPKDKSIVPILLLAAGADPRTPDGLGKSQCTTFLEDVHYAYHDNIKIQVHTLKNKSLGAAEEGNLSSWIYNNNNGLSLATMKFTIENFPVHRTLNDAFFEGEGMQQHENQNSSSVSVYANDEGIEENKSGPNGPSQAKDLSVCYDPLYVMLVLNREVLKSNAILNIKKLFGSHILYLHFAIFSLSSDCVFIRTEAYQFISKLFCILDCHVDQYADKLESKDPCPEGKEVLSCLRSLKNAILGKKLQLPSL